ncbi:MAG: hypothetical protein ACFN04_08865, partial [Propionibacterium acidifaciens]
MSDPAEEVEPVDAVDEGFFVQTGPSLFGDEEPPAPAAVDESAEGAAAVPDEEDEPADEGFDPDDPSLGEPDDGQGPDGAVDEGPDAEIAAPS